MFLSKFLGITILVFSLSVAVAGERGANPDKPSLYTSETMMVSMLVEAVDYESRLVTLRETQGELITFTAGEEIRNLAQLKPGDIVDAEYTRKQSLEVYDNPGLVPGSGDFSAMGTAEQGEKPGMTSFDTTVVTATVQEINFEDNTFKLKWFDDSIEQFTAMNPENLKKAEVGDVVVITETVTVNVSIAEPEAE